VIGAGRLKTRLVIMAPMEADDGQGGVTRGFAAAATVWAAVLPGRGRRTVAADAVAAVVGVRILLRNAVALSLQHRLVDGDKTYSIASLREIDDGRLIEIDAEWRVA
jgi:head-tail adaptor